MQPAFVFTLGLLSLLGSATVIHASSMNSPPVGNVGPTAGIGGAVSDTEGTVPSLTQTPPSPLGDAADVRENNSIPGYNAMMNAAGQAGQISPPTNAQTLGAPTEEEVPITDASSALAANFALRSSPSIPPSSPSNIDESRSSNDSSSSGGGGWFGKILGGNKNTGNQDTTGTKPQSSNSVGAGGRTGMMPPPPPPLPQLQQQRTKQGHQQQQPPYQQQQSQRPPNQHYNPYQQPPPNANPYNTPPPYSNQNNYIDPSSYQNLLYELDESTLREMTLTHQLHNMSSYISSLTTESEKLMAKADVLTERLADSESNFNYVHNRNLELDANCTLLTSMVEELKKEIEKYQSSQKSMEDEKSDNEKVVNELRAELRRVTDELEQLACLVETERFEFEKADFLRELKRKQLAKRRKKKKGFWSWLFGFDNSNSVGDRDLEAVEEEERLRAAQELARSTLLHALQTERTSVDELEASVITLQRNNSAIMDVVQSRNELISELNDRVAVFEEDKMVLKAALRQLQKEIKEEAPRTQLLADELDAARERERVVREELEQLRIDHDEECDEFDARWEEAEKEWNQTKEELYLIGSYVDQLEDRLATFAIAKKEIELREKQCAELEAEAKAWKLEVDETKPLLEDLVKERAETNVKMEGLLQQIDELKEQIADWEQRVEEAECRNEEIKSESARQLFLRVEEEKRAWNEHTLQQIQEEKRAWGVLKDREMSDEKAALQERAAEEFEQRLAQKKAEWEREAEESSAVQLRNQQSALETKLMQQWNTNMSQQRADLEAHFQEEMQRRLDSERAAWQKLKDQELEERLSKERAEWEAVQPLITTNHVSDVLASALEDEVERAAAKVYERLEQNGVAFGVSNPSLESVKDVFAEAEQVRIGANDMSDSDVTEDETESETDEGSEIGEDAVNDITLDDALDQPAATETNDTAVNSTTLLTSGKQMKRPPRPSRSVPFRKVRKAFSRATGMHGVVTPSSVQLRQRGMRGKRPPLKHGKRPVAESEKRNGKGSIMSKENSQKEDAKKLATHQRMHPQNPDRSLVTPTNGTPQEDVELELWNDDLQRDSQTQDYRGDGDYYDDGGASSSLSYEGQEAYVEPPLPDFGDL